MVDIYLVKISKRAGRDIGRIPGHVQPKFAAWIYRAIYILSSDGFVDFVFIEEVNKHDY